ncbi:MAG: zf-HC2 domain-containing protein [Pyrinomonadaceae bacterium]
MNCDECKNLIGAFMDNEIEESHASMVREHLAICGLCSQTCEDLVSILDVCSVEPSSEIVPPNSQALWCRINNIIENEVAPPLQSAPERRFWQFSFGQLAAALGCIALISSLLTVVAVRNYGEPAAEDFTTRSAATQTTLEKFLSKVGLTESPQQARDRRLHEQRAAISYWDERVMLRRAQWDRATRDAFDRNLHVIEESVSEYTMILASDPDDELSGEMLDSVLSEKMNLLRDFSDL